jgi:hypothetical protein
MYHKQWHNVLQCQLILLLLERYISDLSLYLIGVRREALGEFNVHFFSILITYTLPYFSQMVFCLTTGKSWLFGIVDTASLTGKVCWKTSKFHITAAPEFETIKSLIKLILLWVRQFYFWYEIAILRKYYRHFSLQIY